MAIHGWLDNANSFVPLLDHLTDVDLIAIDLPGHGHSDHLAAGAHYHFVDMVQWITQIADTLRWETFSVMGHSLGACIAPYVAVSLPERCKAILQIEGVGPLTEPAEELPQRLQQSAMDHAAHQRFESRTFTQTSGAVASRLRANQMLESSAKLIVERQLKPVDGGYQWRFDPRHRMRSALYQTEPQILAVLGAIPCPTVCVLSEDGYPLQREQTLYRLDAMKNLELHRIPGHHHVHMDTPELVAPLLNHFMTQRGTDHV